MIRARGSAVVAVMLLASLASAQARVWTVDAAGGPGADFTDLPPAIAAASAGDRIEIRGPGMYSAFTLGKGLEIEAMASNVSVAGAMTVQGIPTAEQARLAGFSGSAVRLAQCAGSVQLFRLSLGVWASGPAVLATDCAAVLVARCDLFASFVAFPQVGVVTAMRSPMALQQCTIIGGDGANASSHSPAASGKTAVWATDCEILLADCRLTGGAGGSGIGTFPPGSGGSALLSNGPTLVMHGSRLTAGLGMGGPNGFAIWGMGPVARVTADCFLTGQANNATTIPVLPAVNSPGSGTLGQPVTLTFTALPGTFLLLGLDLRSGYLALPGSEGAWLLTPGFLPLDLYAVGTPGVLPFTLTVPVDATLRNQLFLFQALAYEPTAARMSFTDLGDLRVR